MYIFSFHSFYRSWFVGDYVIEKGSLKMITRVDPLFLLLPLLAQNSDKYRSIVDLLSVFNSYHILLKSIENNAIDVSVVADVKQIENECYFKYNQDKTLSWLKYKINSIVTVLKKLNVNVSNKSSQIVGFTSGRKEQVEESCYTRYAKDLIGMYIDKQLSDKLDKLLHIEGGDQSNQTCLLDNGMLKKRPVSEISEEPTENYYHEDVKKESEVKKSKMSKSQKQLMKVNKSGMKSISSYFAKK